MNYHLGKRWREAKIKHKGSYRETQQSILWPRSVAGKEKVKRKHIKIGKILVSSQYFVSLIQIKIV